MKYIYRGMYYLCAVPFWICFVIYYVMALAAPVAEWFEEHGWPDGDATARHHKYKGPYS